MFICGYKERYLGYKSWMKELAKKVGDNCIIIPNADHFFGTYEGRENTGVFEILMKKILTWIDRELNNNDIY